MHGAWGSGTNLKVALQKIGTTALSAHCSLHVQASERLVAHVSECDYVLHGGSLSVAATLSLLSLLLEVGRLGVARRGVAFGWLPLALRWC